MTTGLETRESSVGRALRLLFAASAVAELPVGVAAVVAPGALTWFLLGAAVDDTGAVATRIAGIALIALAVGWWLDRGRLDLARLRRVGGPYLVYNFGIGALLVGHASTAAHLVPVSWLVGVIHLLAGAAFAAGLVRLPRSAPSG